MLGRFLFILILSINRTSPGERIEVMQPERSQHKDLFVLEPL